MGVSLLLPPPQPAKVMAVVSRSAMAAKVARRRAGMLAAKRGVEIDVANSSERTNADESGAGIRVAKRVTNRCAEWHASIINLAMRGERRLLARSFSGESHVIDAAAPANAQRMPSSNAKNWSGRGIAGGWKLVGGCEGPMAPVLGVVVTRKVKEVGAVTVVGFG